MSWQEFSTAFPEFSSLREAAPRFQSLLRSVLIDDPGARLDNEQLGQYFEQDPDLVLDYLVVMEKEGLVKPVFQWNCENRGGPTLEAESLADFPSFAACDRCGEIHEFDKDQVSVIFEATDALLTEI